MAHKCNRPVVSIQMSTRCQKKAGNGLFACRSFGNEDVEEFFYESLAHTDLRKKSANDETVRGEVHDGHDEAASELWSRAFLLLAAKSRSTRSEWFRNHFVQSNT